MGAASITNSEPFVSVIVPVYNGRNFLCKSLRGLFESEFSSFEVIVVDDGSTDDSAEISRKFGAEVLAMPVRSGPSAARNSGAAAAKGDILLFVDADVVVKPDTLAKVAFGFEKQPEISALFGSYDDEPAEQNFLSQYKNLQHHFVHQSSSRQASTFWSGLGAVRRDVFIALGGFDCHRFEVPSIEDIELGLRLRADGHKILLDRDIQAKHLKKWQAGSLLRTEVFCRAVPWSKLILESRGLINDLNLKTSDRLSAALVGLSLVLAAFLYWEPALLLLIVLLLVAVVLLNLKIIRFFAKKRGILFAALSVPWQLLYYFYCGATFLFCWFYFALPPSLGVKKREEIG